ncbi:unnamed protein product, partial [Didymodactylos carnosus]
MSDYLSRSPVDEAEEDSDEFIPIGTKATQTDELTFYGQHNPTIVAAVQTRSMKNQQSYYEFNGLVMKNATPPVPYVPSGEIRQTILRIYHDTPANGAHFGRDRTIHKIKQRYFWPTAYKDIRNYVQSCIKCAQHNPHRKKPPGALKSIPPPEGAWHLLTMDFHGPITPVSQRGNKYIISITDVLSK